MDFYNFYNFPDAAALGIFAALVMLAMAVAGLWYSSKPKSTKAGAVGGVVMFYNFALLLVVSIHLGVTHKAFDSAVDSSFSWPLPATSMLAILVAVAVLLQMVSMVAWAAFRRNLLALTGLLTLAFASFAVTADLALMLFMEDGLALALTAGWIGTTLSALAFIIVGGVRGVRAYGSKKSSDGEQLGLDRANLDTSTSVAGTSLGTESTPWPPVSTSSLAGQQQNPSDAIQRRAGI